MKLFLCLLDRQGHGIPATLRRAYESLPRSRGLAYRWQSFAGGVALSTGHDLPGGPAFVRDGGSVAIGTVRLDNRADVRRWAGCGRDEAHGDLGLVLRAWKRHGPSCVQRFLGDFAFVLWNPAAGIAIAACDAFAVKKLFYRERGETLAFASRGELLADTEQYEVQYLAEIVALCPPSPGLTPYRASSPSPAAPCYCSTARGLRSSNTGRPQPSSRRTLPRP